MAWRWMPTKHLALNTWCDCFFFVISIQVFDFQFDLCPLEMFSALQVPFYFQKHVSLHVLGVSVLTRLIFSLVNISPKYNQPRWCFGLLDCASASGCSMARSLGCFLLLIFGYIGCFTRETLGTNKNTGNQRTVRITKVIESTDPGTGKRKKIGMPCILFTGCLIWTIFQWNLL